MHLPTGASAGPLLVPALLQHVLTAALVVGGGAAAARGQDTQRRIEQALRQADPTYRLRFDPDLTLTERAEVDYGGFFTFTFLNTNEEAGNSTRLLQYETTLYGRATLGGAHTGFVRARFRYRDFSPGDSFDGRGDRWTEPFLDRYWYEFDSRRAVAISQGKETASNVNVRAGRQFIDWGAGLVLSENLYAVRPTVEADDRWSISGVIGVTPGDESVIDFDASRADYDQDTKRGFFGGQVSYRTKSSDTLYAYALHMPDYNTSTEARIDIGFPVEFDYTATYLGAGASCTLTPDLIFLGEFVYEIGESKSDPLFGFQTTEDIRAFAGRAQVTWLLRDEHLSRVEAEVLIASGDDDRLVSTDTVGGNTPGTDDNGFNSLGYANTGLAFAPSLSNLITLRVGASTFPARGDPRFRNLQVGADVLVLNKFDPDAPIDEPTGTGRYLGTEADLFVNYRLMSDLAVNIRYGVFIPSSTVASDDIRQFVLAGVTISF